MISAIRPRYQRFVPFAVIVMNMVELPADGQFSPGSGHRALSRETVMGGGVLVCRTVLRVSPEAPEDAGQDQHGDAKTRGKRSRRARRSVGHHSATLQGRERPPPPASGR